MFNLAKFGFTLCILCLVVILVGCQTATGYSASKTTWGDVTHKFIELEQEKAATMKALRENGSRLRVNVKDEKLNE